MGLLVTIHEWGHFIVAKFFKVKVLTFSIGFGKPLLYKQIGETEYRLSLIPLGGYVKFLDERNDDTIGLNEDLTRAFNRQTVFKRFAIVFAGPFINLVFAWVVFSWLYFWGMPGIKPLFQDVVPNSSLSQTLSSKTNTIWQVMSVGHQTTQTWQSVHQKLLADKLAGKESVDVALAAFSEKEGVTDSVYKNIQLSLKTLDLNKARQDWLASLGFVPFVPKIPPILSKVVQGSAAEKYGFKSGDRVIALNGKLMHSWSDFATLVKENPSGQVDISYERGEHVYDVQLTLGSKQQSGRDIGVFGAAIQVNAAQMKKYQTIVSFPFIQAMHAGLNHSVSLIEISFDMIRKMFQNEVSPSNLSGPIAIADYSGKALEMGWISFFSLLGLLSLSLGFLNLLPIPMLDGGHLTLYIVEMIKGSPINEVAELFAQKLGFMIVVGLTLFALINDLVRISDD